MSTTSSKNNKTHAEIEAFWTQENRDAAIPKPLPEAPTELGNIPLPNIPQNPIGTPPNTSINDINRDIEIKAGLAIPVASPKTYPWSCNGKLFFTWKGTKYVGSAGSILNEVLLTAAHNIYDEDEWSDDFYYYPAYPEYGKRWSWSRVAIFTAWKDHQDFAYDYAMILTNTSMKEVGSLGCLRDLPAKGRTWTAIGYPAEPPYAGNTMSSGGNWVTKVGGKDFVNGVQSTRGGAPSYANSPYIKNEDYLKLLTCVSTDTCN